MIYQPTIFTNADRTILEHLHQSPASRSLKPTAGLLPRALPAPQGAANAAGQEHAGSRPEGVGEDYGSTGPPGTALRIIITAHRLCARRAGWCLEQAINQQ